MKSDNDKLRERLKGFENTVRWGDLHNMYAYLKPQEGKPVEIQTGLNNIRVVSYEELRPFSRIGDDRVLQTIEITYVLKDVQMLRTIRDEQVWLRDPESKIWYRHTPIPPFQ